MAPVRPLETRKADTLRMLATPAIDVWVATAAAAGVPYLVPLSLAWVDERVLIALEATSPTALNLAASREARLVVGPTRDVVMIDAVLDRTVSVDADQALGNAYVAPGGLGPARLARLRVPCPSPGSDPGVARIERDPGPHPHARGCLADLG
jgi:hypothetical protein